MASKGVLKMGSGSYREEIAFSSCSNILLALILISLSWLPQMYCDSKRVKVDCLLYRNWHWHLKLRMLGTACSSSIQAAISKILHLPITAQHLITKGVQSDRLVGEGHDAEGSFSFTLQGRCLVNQRNCRPNCRLHSPPIISLND